MLILRQGRSHRGRQTAYGSRAITDRARNQTHVYHSSWSNQTGYEIIIFELDVWSEGKYNKGSGAPVQLRKPALCFSIICMEDWLKGNNQCCITSTHARMDSGQKHIFNLGQFFQGSNEVWTARQRCCQRGKANSKCARAVSTHTVHQDPCLEKFYFTQSLGWNKQVQRKTSTVWFHLYEVYLK